MLRVRGLRAGRSRGERERGGLQTEGTTRGNPAREEHEIWDRGFEALAETRAL